MKNLILGVLFFALGMCTMGAIMAFSETNYSIELEPVTSKYNEAIGFEKIVNHGDGMLSILFTDKAYDEVMVEELENYMNTGVITFNK